MIYKSGLGPFSVLGSALGWGVEECTLVLSTCGGRVVQPEISHDHCRSSQSAFRSALEGRWSEIARRTSRDGDRWIACFFVQVHCLLQKNFTLSSSVLELGYAEP